MEDVIEFKGGQQGRRAEEGLPRLPARAHGSRRRLLVRRAQHAGRHRVRRQRREADAARRARRSRTSSASPSPRARRREEGAAAARVRRGRAGPCGHRPVRRLQRRDQRDRRRPLEAQGAREHLRPGDARSSSSSARSPSSRHADEARGFHQMAKKKSWPRSSRSRSRRGRRRRRRRSGPRSARTASTSWTSARRTTPPTESQRGTVIPAEITIYEDRSFTFVTKTPPTPVLLRQAAGRREGRARRRGARRSARSRATRSARSRRRRCPT